MKRVLMSKKIHPCSSMDIKECVVIGGGLAGVAAAIRCAERNCTVVLVEGAGQLGGRVSGWTVGSGDDAREMQHGYHALFPSYAECSRLMRMADIELMPEDAYVLGDGARFYSFASVRGLWWSKLRALHAIGMFSWRDCNCALLRFVRNCIRFNKKNVDKTYGRESFAYALTCPRVWQTFCGP